MHDPHKSLPLWSIWWGLVYFTMPTSCCVPEFYKKGYKSSTVRLWGKKVDPWIHANHWDKGRSSYHDRCGNRSLFATFSGWKTLENHLTHKLLWCLVAFQHHFHAKSETEEKFLFHKRFLITPFCCHSVKLVGRANYNKPDLQQSKTFWGKYLSKQRTKASLASLMGLVLGTDQANGHPH